jgi:hypothetical protein
VRVFEDSSNGENWKALGEIDMVESFNMVRILVRILPPAWIRAYDASRG